MEHACNRAERRRGEPARPQRESARAKASGSERVSAERGGPAHPGVARQDRLIRDGGALAVADRVGHADERDLSRQQVHEEPFVPLAEPLAHARGPEPEVVAGAAAQTPLDPLRRPPRSSDRPTSRSSDSAGSAEALQRDDADA